MKNKGVKMMLALPIVGILWFSIAGVFRVVSLVTSTAGADDAGLSGGMMMVVRSGFNRILGILALLSLILFFVGLVMVCRSDLSNKIVGFGRRNAKKQFWQWFRVLLLVIVISIIGSEIQTAVTPQGRLTMQISQMAAGGQMEEMTQGLATIMEEKLTGVDMDTMSPEELATIQEEVMNSYLEEKGLGGLTQTFNIKNIITSGLLANLIQIIFTSFIVLGFITCALVVARGGKMTWSMFFAKRKQYFKLLGGYILYVLGTLVGFLLFIIPGIIWAVRWSFYSYLIVDKGMGPIQALKESWKLTKGRFWEIVGVQIVIGCIVLLGALVIGIGLLWAIPTAMIAMAYYYTIILGEGGEEKVEDEDAKEELPVGGGEMQ